MKSFQFKDLMVNVAPAGEQALCLYYTRCGYLSWCGYYSWCGYRSGCEYNTIIRTPNCPQIAQQPAEQAAVAAPRAGFGCGFGGYTCNYGTYCGFSIEPCGYTCDYGNTHPTRPFFAQEQAAVAAPAGAQAVGAPGGAGNIVCFTHTICPAFTCHFGTCFGLTCGFLTCRFGCSVVISDCRIGGTVIPCAAGTCGFTPDPTPPIHQGDPQAVVNQLAAVKAQLQQELAAIEKQEQAVAEALKPQTAADVEELQGKLRDAIAELDKQKQELQKKPEKPSKK